MVSLLPDSANVVILSKRVHDPLFRDFCKSAEVRIGSLPLHDQMNVIRHKAVSQYTEPLFIRGLLNSRERGVNELDLREERRPVCRAEGQEISVLAAVRKARKSARTATGHILTRSNRWARQVRSELADCHSGADPLGPRRRKNCDLCSAPPSRRLHRGSRQRLHRLRDSLLNPL